MKIRRFMVSMAAIALAVSGLLIAAPALAQGPGTGVRLANFWAVEACSTTDYATVVADALGITAPELRQALAGGRSLSALANENDVELSAVEDAVTEAQNADIDAALEAGLITEDEAQTLRDALSGKGITIMPGRRGQSSDQDDSDDQDDDDDSAERPFHFELRMPEGMEGLIFELMPGGMVRFGMGAGGLGAGGLGVELVQPVKTYQVAASALNMTCAELVQAVKDGASIAEVAAQTEGGFQAVTDALIAAHESAIDTALDEGLISQVEATSRKARVINNVLMEIASSRPAAGRGMGFVFRGGQFPEAPGGLMERFRGDFDFDLDEFLERFRQGFDLDGLMDELHQRFGRGMMMGGRGQRGR